MYLEFKRKVVNFVGRQISYIQVKLFDQSKKGNPHVKMFKVLLVQVTSDAKLIDSYPAMPLGNPNEILNELVSFYFDKSSMACSSIPSYTH
jgi:hypothetical protein